MQPPRFLIGKLVDGSFRWAAIDANVHHVESRLGESRFNGYLKPFKTEEAARAALVAAGASLIEPEAGRRKNG